MAGLIPPDPRTGNRLEYLAHYILSKLGTAVPVLRQEDVGVDFYCALGKNEPVGITIGNAFAVQLKSGKIPVLKFGGRTNGVDWTWRDYEIKWFLNLELPLFFGVPHEKEKRLDLYATSLARFAAAKSTLPYQIQLLPGNEGDPAGPLHPDNQGEESHVQGLPRTCDGRIYKFNLGPPIVSCTLDALDNATQVDSFKERLRQFLQYERVNPIYRALSLPYWTWAKYIVTNKSHELAFAYDIAKTSDDREAVLGEVVPFICALGLIYKNGNEDAKLADLKGIASQLPRNNIPEDVMRRLPELFP